MGTAPFPVTAGMMTNKKADTTPVKPMADAAQEIASKALAHQTEQKKAGRSISITDAVHHVMQS